MPQHEMSTLTVDAILLAVQAHVTTHNGIPLKREPKRTRRVKDTKPHQTESASTSDIDSDGAVVPTEPATRGMSPSVTKFVVEYAQTLISVLQRPYVNVQQEAVIVAQYYRGISSGPQDVPSYEALNTLLSSTYRHAKRRIPLWAAVDRQADGTLRCAYNNSLIETAKCERLAKADEEHLVPQSWHKGSKLHPRGRHASDLYRREVVERVAGKSPIWSTSNTERRRRGSCPYGR